MLQDLRRAIIQESVSEVWTWIQIQSENDVLAFSSASSLEAQDEERLKASVCGKWSIARGVLVEVRMALGIA